MKRLLPLLLALLAACPAEDAPPPDPTPDPGLQGFGVSARADLRMKRWRQVSLDLQSALLLRPEEVCAEAGLYPCTDIHAVPLGGVSVDNGIFQPVELASATTALTVERLVLQACWNRLALDLADPGQAVVFKHAPLDSPELAPAAGEAQVVEITRRLLARDPVPEETEALLALQPGIVEDGGANADWALMACFALGTTTEALLY